MRTRRDAREMALLAALLIFVAGLCLRPMDESDLFFRLRVGQEILAHHALPGRNLFSFTAPDHPDLDLAWGFEVAAALLYRWGGFPAVVVGKTVLMLIVFAAAFAVCRRRGAGPLVAAVTLAGAAIVMRDRLVERPHVVSFLGEVGVLAALAGLDRSGRPWSLRRWIACALALVAWANAHAGVFVGAGMAALAGVGAIARGRHWWRPGRLPSPTRFGAGGGGAGPARRAFILAGMAAVAATVTPVGPAGIARYLALHLTVPRLHTIDEFRPATWRSDAGGLAWLAAAAVVVAAAWVVSATRRRRRAAASAAGSDAAFTAARGAALAASSGAGEPTVGAPGLTEVLPAAGVALLGVASVRFSADAALVAAPLIAQALAVLVDAAAGARGALVERVRTLASGGVLAALLLAVLAPRLADARAGRPAVDVSVDRAALPLDAIRFADEHGLRDRMYNDFEVGAYLLFEGYPRHLVFVDPRLPAYPEELHRELGRFDHDRASWDAVMARYGVESALLAYAGVNRRVAWWEPRRWALVYRAGDARVFVRRDPERRALIAAREIPLTFDFTVENGTTSRPLFDRPPGSPVSDCEWQRRLGDVIFELDGGRAARARAHYDRALAVPGCLASADEAALAAWLGVLDLGTRAWARASALLDRALELAPDDTRTRANRATALERLGRRAAAAEDWAEIAAAAPDSDVGRAAQARVRALRADP